MLEAAIVAVTVELAKLSLKGISTTLIGEGGRWRKIAEVDKAFYDIFPRGSQVVLVASAYNARLEGFAYEDRCTGIRDTIALMSLSDYLAKAKIAVSVYDHALTKSQESLLNEHLIVAGSPPFNEVADVLMERCIPSGKLRFDFANRTIFFDGESKIDTEDTVRGVIACLRNSVTEKAPPSKRVLLFAGTHQLGTHLAISYFINRDVQRAIRRLVRGKHGLNWAILVRGERTGLDIQHPTAERLAYW